MRYGVAILPEYRWREAERLWRRAEELGFDHAWTYDHLVWGGAPESPWFGTVSTLTAAAMVTERIGLGTYVTSPNFRHPVTFTRDVLSLDDISGGRFVCGMGAGGDVDAGILGPELSRAQRTDRFEEFVVLLDRMLTGDHVDFAGTYFSAVDGRSVPGTLGAARIPFVVAANGPRALRLAVGHGSGWLTTGASGAMLDRFGVDADTELERWWAGLRILCERMDELLAPAGRAAPLDRYLSLDSGGRPAFSSPGFFQEQAGRAAELGFTDVIAHWPRASGPFAADTATLEQGASTVLPGA